MEGTCQRNLSRKFIPPDKRDRKKKEETERDETRKSVQGAAKYKKGERKWYEERKEGKEGNKAEGCKTTLIIPMRGSRDLTVTTSLPSLPLDEEVVQHRGKPVFVRL